MCRFYKDISSFSCYNNLVAKLSNKVNSCYLEIFEGDMDEI